MPIQPKQQPPYYEEATTEANPIKQYIVSIEQFGTNAPSVSYTFKNTLSGTPTFNYEGVGEYSLTLTNGFPLAKTSVEIQVGNNLTGGYATILDWSTPDAIGIYTFNNAGAKANDILYAFTTLTITVYP